MSAPTSKPHSQQPQPRLTSTDRAFLDTAFDIKEQLPSRPILSGFRVVSLLTYTTPTSPQLPPQPQDNKGDETEREIPLDGTQGQRDAHGGKLCGISYVIGTNCEIACMGQSICAERSALAKLRLIPFVELGDIYLVSDASFELAPGLLCREFLSQWLSPTRRIILAAADIGKKDGYTYQVTSLAQLYPHPHLYKDHAHASQVTQVANTLANQAQHVKQIYPEKPMWETLYQQVVSKTSCDTRDSLYPIRLAAGILFSNGEIQVAAQTKLAEFGHTLDPISKLLIIVENNLARGVTPVVIMQADQFGVLHAPGAAARATYKEGGHTTGLFVFHDPCGVLHACAVSSLIPDDVDGVLESSLGSSRSRTGTGTGTGTGTVTKSHSHHAQQQQQPPQHTFTYTSH